MTRVIALLALLALLAFLVALPLPAWAASQFNCLVPSVPAFGTVGVPVSGCQEAPSAPIDCLHFAIVSAGPTSGYVTFAHRDLSGTVTRYFPLWGPSPGWFHSPQHALSTPDLNYLLFVNATGTPTSMRALGIGLTLGEPGCI